MDVAFQLGLGLVRLYLAFMKYFLEHILTIVFHCILGTPGGCPALGQFRFLILTPLKALKAP